MNIIRSIATYILLAVITIISAFSQNSAQAWLPGKDELSSISNRMAIIVVGLTVLLITGLAIFIVVIAT